MTSLEEIVHEYARCNFDGRPLSPGDKRAVLDFAATLRLRETDAALRWCELVPGENGYEPYWRKWYCPQPEPGQAWRSVREQWHHPGADDVPVLDIYEIEVTGAAETPASARAAERAGPAGPGTCLAAGAGTPAGTARASTPGTPPQGAGGTGRDPGTGEVPR